MTGGRRMIYHQRPGVPPTLHHSAPETPATLRARELRLLLLMAGTALALVGLGLLPLLLLWMASR